jgi:two-component system phosphate regulon sensor histidine kinase PhoR
MNQLHLIIWTMIVAAIMTTILMWSISVFSRSLTEERHRTAGRNLSQSVAANWHSPEELGTLLHNTAHVLGGKVWVVTFDGRLIAGDDPDLLADFRQTGVPLSQSAYYIHDHKLLPSPYGVLVVPIQVEDEDIAALVLAIPYAFPWSLSQYGGAFILLTVVLTALGVWWVMERRVNAITETIPKLTQEVYRYGENLQADWQQDYHHEDIHKLSQSIGYLIQTWKGKLLETDQVLADMRMIIGNLPVGVVLINRRGKVILMNASAGDLLSLDSEGSVGEYWVELVKDYALLTKIQEVEKSEISMKTEIHSVLPENRNLEVFLNHMPHDYEESPAVLMVVRDVTDFQRLSQMRSDFVANVSHELRTPLTSIKGFAETLLAGDVDDPATTHRFLEIIETEADRLTRLIDDLLDLSRIESGRIRLDFKRTNIKRIITETVETLKPQMTKVGITVTLDIPDTLPLLMADPDRIAQVLINYIDNSTKFTPNGGQIWISVKDRAEDLVVEVRDNGIGIPKADLDRIFERFYRVDKARARTSGGTGLGLAIVKHIVEAHGGNVFVDSEPNLGSRFGFTLPKGE